jgi:hypothetical protein
MPFIVNGTLTEGTGTVTFTGTSATDIENETYYNLILNHSGTTFTSTGDTTVSGVLTVTAGTFNADNDTWHLTGSGTPFVVTDTFTPASSTISYEGTGATNMAVVDYYNLTLNGTGPFALAGDLTSTITSRYPQAPSTPAAIPYPLARTFLTVEPLMLAPVP